HSTFFRASGLFFDSWQAYTYLEGNCPESGRRFSRGLLLSTGSCPMSRHRRPVPSVRRAQLAVEVLEDRCSPGKWVPLGEASPGDALAGAPLAATALDGGAVEMAISVLPPQ